MAKVITQSATRSKPSSTNRRVLKQGRDTQRSFQQTPQGREQQAIKNKIQEIQSKLGDKPIENYEKEYRKLPSNIQAQMLSPKEFEKHTIKNRKEAIQQHIETETKKVDSNINNLQKKIEDIKKKMSSIVRDSSGNKLHNTLEREVGDMNQRIIQLNMGKQFISQGMTSTDVAKYANDKITMFANIAYQNQKNKLAQAEYEKNNPVVMINPKTGQGMSILPEYQQEYEKKGFIKGRWDYSIEAPRFSQENIDKLNQIGKRNEKKIINPFQKFVDKKNEQKKEQILNQSIKEYSIIPKIEMKEKSYNKKIEEVYDKYKNQSNITYTEKWGEIDRSKNLIKNIIDDITMAGSYDRKNKKINYNKLLGILTLDISGKEKINIINHEYGHSLSKNVKKLINNETFFKDSARTDSFLDKFTRSSYTKEERPEEDLANSFKEYMKNPESFRKEFPKQTKVFEHALGYDGTKKDYGKWDNTLYKRPSYKWGEYTPKQTTFLSKSRRDQLLENFEKEAKDKGIGKDLRTKWKEKAIKDYAERKITEIEFSDTLSKEKDITSELSTWTPLGGVYNLALRKEAGENVSSIWKIPETYKTLRHGLYSTTAVGAIAPVLAGFGIGSINAADFELNKDSIDKLDSKVGIPFTDIGIDTEGMKLPQRLALRVSEGVLYAYVFNKGGKLLSKTPILQKGVEPFLNVLKANYISKLTGHAYKGIKEISVSDNEKDKKEGFYKLADVGAEIIGNKYIEPIIFSKGNALINRITGAYRPQALIASHYPVENREFTKDNLPKEGTRMKVATGSAVKEDITKKIQLKETDKRLGKHKVPEEIISHYVTPLKDSISVTGSAFTYGTWKKNPTAYENWFKKVLTLDKTAVQQWKDLGRPKLYNPNIEYSEGILRYSKKGETPKQYYKRLDKLRENGEEVIAISPKTMSGYKQPEFELIKLATKDRTFRVHIGNNKFGDKIYQRVIIYKDNPRANFQEIFKRNNEWVALAKRDKSGKFEKWLQTSKKNKLTENEKRKVNDLLKNRQEIPKIDDTKKLDYNEFLKMPITKLKYRIENIKESFKYLHGTPQTKLDLAKIVLAKYKDTIGKGFDNSKWQKSGYRHASKVEDNMKKITKYYDLDVTKNEIEASARVHDMLKMKVLNWKDEPMLADLVRKGYLDKIPEIKRLSKIEKRRVANAIMKHQDINPRFFNELLKSKNLKDFSIKNNLLQSYRTNDLEKLLINADRLDITRYGAKVDKKKLFNLDTELGLIQKKGKIDIQKKIIKEGEKEWEKLSHKQKQEIKDLKKIEDEYKKEYYDNKKKYGYKSTASYKYNYYNRKYGKLNKYKEENYKEKNDYKINNLYKKPSPENYPSGYPLGYSSKYPQSDPYKPNIQFIPKSSKEQKNLKLILPKGKKTTAWQPVIHIDRKRRMLGKLYETKQGALNEGMIITDNIPTHKVSARSVQAPKGLIKKARSAKIAHKFVKSKGTLTEKKLFRNDKSGERRGNFNWQKIIRAT